MRSSHAPARPVNFGATRRCQRFTQSHARRVRHISVDSNHSVSRTHVMDGAELIGLRQKSDRASPLKATCAPPEGRWNCAPPAPSLVLLAQDTSFGSNHKSSQKSDGSTPCTRRYEIEIQSRFDLQRKQIYRVGIEIRLSIVISSLFGQCTEGVHGCLARKKLCALLVTGDSTCISEPLPLRLV